MEKGVCRAGSKVPGGKARYRVFFREPIRSIKSR